MSDRTVIFFGAGTTTACDMPATVKQGKLFSSFFFNNDTVFREWIHNNVKILKDEDIDVLTALKQEPQIQKLKQFVNDTFTSDSFDMMSFYNLVDMSITERRGFRCGEKVYSVDEIQNFRSILLVLLQTLFGLLENNILRDKEQEFNKLKRFFKAIAKKELNKRRMQYINDSVDLQSRKFLFTDVEYISLNWDVLVLWAMMLAHKELNNSNSNYISDKYGISKLKVFNEFFAYLNSSDTGSEKNKDWFPYSQPVAFRLNDTEHPSDKRVVLFPTYFPHGQTHWLECPICGKLTMYLDKQFRVYSQNFAMSPKRQYRCSHCDQRLNLENSAMLLQTSYKVKSPYNEEIQRSMRIAINNAKRLVFIGYSLPNDDIEYRSIFRISSSEPKKVYVVLYQSGAPNKFIPAKEVLKNNNDNNEEIKRYCDIFGEENVQVNYAGFPDASDKVLEILKQE